MVGWQRIFVECFIAKSKPKRRSQADAVMDARTFEIVVRFEKSYHDDIFRWMVHKIGDSIKSMQLLDISVDGCAFSSIVGQKINALSITTAVRQGSLGKWIFYF